MRMGEGDRRAWQEGLKRAAGSYGLIGPVKEKEFHSFRPLAGGELPDLAFQNSRLSPKHVVYPQTEPMFTYTLDPAREDRHRLKEIVREIPPRAVVGIRPCDAKAFVLVRMNFDTPDYQDPYWLRAYEATTFIGLGCNAPCSSCFCTTAGCGPFHEEGLDILLADLGEAFAARVLTPKGDAPAEAENAYRECVRAAEGRISSFVQTEHLRSIPVNDLYNAPFWEEISFSCINCGTCTYSCPTCWCFDIQDETRGKNGVRLKLWDSCMYPLFTLHGSGHNPRGTKLHRVRQRFMHKLKYFVEKYDRGIQCVGCGRCVRLCPVNIDIRRVCNTMNGFAVSGEACAIP